ncbi:MAG: zinc-ribbon domain-containing protein [Alphaproteobacteria bacterium]|nr:MAG: zinc-ribbon domain-containing protein [Alphaproteobacteria bacterium]
MRCPSCKADVPGGSKFCLECGAALLGRCPSCGNTNPASAKFCLECGHKLPSIGVEAAAGSTIDAAAPQSSQTGSAERRQLTVLFCDLVGSTALSARLDPEDMREIMSAYHHRCTEVIGKSGGFVAKYMGDGVLAYFGYPQAHEDDAERAVRCGLALADAASRLQTSYGANFQVRIGIATGVVVVGDLIGEGAAQEQEVVGDTPNLAARLQTHAEPGQVVIAPSTRRLTSGLFEYRDLGRVVLKGLADPIQAWQVLAASPMQSRFEAQHETSLAPLVGREEELELLLRRWNQASQGEGRVVLLTGQPGVGKSRLIAALQERLQSQSHVRIRYFCSPQHSESALYPVINQLERAARFERGDAPEQKLVKLQNLLAPILPEQVADLGLLADLLSVPRVGQRGSFEMDPQKRKEKTFAALFAQLRRVEQQRPVLMIYEDVQWIDPTTLELLALMVERAQHMRLLMVVSARPDFTAHWPDYAHVRTASLTRLNRRDATTLITDVAQGRALPDEVINQILVRTDGVPLFIEELTKTVLESGLLRKREHDYVLDGPLATVAIPTTLHDSLMARLDRLTSVRRVAQVGAALGRQFSHELLHAAAEMPERQLSDALEQLVRAELLFQRGTPPSAQYTFKHALVQDVAYASLLRANRQQLHARIARAYETHFPEVVRAEPELVAHHFTEAGLSEAAIEYWQQAGDLAMARSGHSEAIRHFSVALDLLTRLGEKPDRAAKELEICVKLGPALMMVKGPASPEADAIYSRAVALETGEESSARFKALWGRCYCSMASGRLSEAAADAEELFAFAQRLGADDLVLEGHHAKWSASLWCGSLAAVDEHSQEGISRYDCTRHHALAFTFSGHDPGVCARGVKAISMALSGFPQRAMELGAEALTLARSLSHPYTLVLAMWQFGIALQVVRQRRSCGDLATELIELSQEHDFPAMRGAGMFFSGWATADGGELEQGIALMEQGFALFSVGRRITRPYMLATLASAKADFGNPGEGLELLEDALASIEVSGERWWLAEVHRLRGRLLVARGQHDEGEACFRRAIEVSSEQRATMLELRAATSLARLWNDRGRNAEAHDLLAPIYGWFTEGFETLDLKEAEILLDVLASAHEA